MAIFEVLSCEGVGGLRWQSFYERLPIFFRSIHFSPAYARANAELPQCAVYADPAGFVMQPFTLKSDKFGTTMDSLYGYGGPICSSLMNVYEYSARFDKGMDEWRRARAILCERAVLHPRLYQHQSMLFPDWAPSFRKEVVIIQAAPAKLIAGFTKKRQSALSKAQRDGITTRCALTCATPLERFCKLYESTMNRVGASPFFRHSRTFFQNMAAHLHDNIAVVEAVDGKGDVVSAALVLTSPPQAYYQYAGNSGVSGASDLLIMEAARHAWNCGCETMDIGGGLTRDPKDPLLWYKGTFSPDRAGVYVIERIHDEERFTAASKGFEGVGYFPPWRAGEQINAATQGIE